MKHEKIPADVSPQLDTLRGVSALIVLFAHGLQILVAPTWPGFISAGTLAAQAAVMCFFVLSGFLITKSITRNAAAYGTFSPRAYAADRFNRIIPPLVLSLLLVVALWGLAPILFPTGTTRFAMEDPFSGRAGFDVELHTLIGAATFMNGFATTQLLANGPLWSLSFEVWYYVAAGLIAFQRGRGALLAVLLMAVLGWAYRDFLLYSVVWFAGAFVAVVHNADLRLTRISRPAGLVSLFAAVFLGWTYVVDNASAHSMREVVSRAVPYYNVYLGLFFAAALYEIVLGNLRIPAFAPHTANYSYTLYVTHFPLLVVIYGTAQPLIQGKLGSSLAVALAASFACWALAWIAAKWVENWRPVTLRPGAASAPA